MFEFTEGRLTRSPILFAGFAFAGENWCSELVHRGNFGIDEVSNLEIGLVSLGGTIELDRIEDRLLRAILLKRAY